MYIYKFTHLAHCITSFGSTVDEEESVTSLMKPDTASMMLRSLGGWEGTVRGPPERACRGDSADILAVYTLEQKEKKDE